MQKHQTEHIRAVLQALDENMSYREIEAWLHISKTAAGRIRTAAVNSGLSTQELCGLDDEDLQKIFYPPTGKVRVDPDWEQVHSLLKRKKVTLQMLFAEYEKQAEGETYTLNFPKICTQTPARVIISPKGHQLLIGLPAGSESRGDVGCLHLFLFFLQGKQLFSPCVVSSFRRQELLLRQRNFRFNRRHRFHSRHHRPLRVHCCLFDWRPLRPVTLLSMLHPCGHPLHSCQSN